MRCIYRVYSPWSSSFIRLSFSKCRNYLNTSIVWINSLTEVNICYVIGIWFSILNKMTIIFTGSALRSVAIYEQAAHQIEKWSKIGYFIIAKVTPVCCILPKAMANYFVYFSTTVGNDAFELPLPMWYVWISHFVSLLPSHCDRRTCCCYLDIFFIN